MLTSLLLILLALGPVCGMGVAFGENANGFETVWVQVFPSR